MSHKNNVNICNWNEATFSISETDLIKMNWLPYCVDGVQWYVADISTFNNSTEIESTPVKIYKQGADGTITTTPPTGTIKKDGLCKSLLSCVGIGDIVDAPSDVLTNAEIDTIMFNLLGANVPKQYAGITDTTFPQIINYQGPSGNIFFGYNIDTSMFACGTDVKADISLLYTPLGDSDPVDTGLDIIFLAASPSYTILDFTGIIDGTPFPSFPTKVITKLYPAIPTTQQTIAASYDITGLNSINILSYVQGISAADSVRIEGILLEITAGNFEGCKIVYPVRDCNSESMLSTLGQILAQLQTKTQRIHQNYVVTGTTPLVIPAGAISISITKTSAGGIVNISGDNGTNFPLSALNENFNDGVNEAVSTLSAYTITGTTVGTTYKVHILR